MFFKPVNRVSLRLVVIFGLSLFSTNAKAEAYDYDARVGVATGLPPSFIIDSWIGTYVLLKPIVLDRQDPILRELDRYTYTYIRPHFRFLSSGLVNRGALRLDIYPLSYLGGTLGYALTHKRLDGIDSFSKWTGYDCTLISCRDWQENYFIEFKLKAAWERVYTLLFYRRDWIESHTRAAASYDPESSLSIHAPNDHNNHMWGLLGLRTRDANYSLRYRYNRWERSREQLKALSVLSSRKITPHLNFNVEAGYRWTRKNTPFIGLKLEYVFREEPSPES